VFRYIETLILKKWNTSEEVEFGEGFTLQTAGCGMSVLPKDSVQSKTVNRLYEFPSVEK
jgi:hypothetical protein